MQTVTGINLCGRYSSLNKKKQQKNRHCSWRDKQKVIQQGSMQSRDVVPVTVLNVQKNNAGWEHLDVLSTLLVNIAAIFSSVTIKDGGYPLSFWTLCELCPNHTEATHPCYPSTTRACSEIKCSLRSHPHQTHHDRGRPVPRSTFWWLMGKSFFPAFCFQEEIKGWSSWPPPLVTPTENNKTGMLYSLLADLQHEATTGDTWSDGTTVTCMHVEGAKWKYNIPLKRLIWIEI